MATIVVTTFELDGEDPDPTVEKREPIWRRALSLAITAAVIALTVFLWPSMLGGQTRLIIVSGHSMEPTYDLRDIVVARDADGTEVGDVVVFEVPEGEAEGMLIIHRVLEIDDEGFFITKGDNRTTPDQWQLTEEDIVGKPLAHIPKGGKALGFIQNIWVVALLVGLVALFLLWPDANDDEDEEEGDEEQLLMASSTTAPDLDPVEARWRALDDSRAHVRSDAWDDVRVPVGFAEPVTAEESVVPETPTISAPASDDSDPTGDLSADEMAELWLDSELESVIDDDVMADAMAWLDQQLEGFEQPVVH